MKPFEYYNNAGKPPIKPVKPGYKLNMTASEIRNFADETEVYEKQLNEFKQLRKQYYDRQDALKHEFRKDALEEVGLTNHEAGNRAYAFAWDMGHAYGFSEIFSKLEQIATVILG